MPKRRCPLGAHSRNGRIEFGVMIKGGCHFFSSDQGPLLKGGGDVGGECPCERVIFLFVCLEAEVSLRAVRPTSSDAKLMGGGLMWPCRPLHFALSETFLQYVKALGSKHTFTLSVDIINYKYRLLCQCTLQEA